MLSEKIKYQLQLISAWGTVALVILDNVLSYTLNYSDGTANNCSVDAAILLCLILWPALAFLFLTSLVIFLILYIRKSLGKRKLMIGAFSLIIAVSACILNFPLLRVRPAGAQIFLKGFEKWVMNNLDTAKIQSWLKTTDEDYWSLGHTYGNDYPTEVNIPEEFPDQIKKINPRYTTFEKSELGGEKIIRFEWGGPFGHWGIVIGDPNMEMPKLMEEWYSDHDVEFRRILRPGVYIYSRG